MPNISKWFLSLLLARSVRGFSSDIYCGNLAELLEVNSPYCGALYDPQYGGFTSRSPPGVSASQSCPYYASSTLSVTIWVFLTKRTSLGCFLLWDLLQEACICRSVSSNLGSCCLPCVFSSFLVSKRIVGFSVYSAFHLLEQNGDFQAPFMWNWKPEVHLYNLCAPQTSPCSGGEIVSERS